MQLDTVKLKNDQLIFTVCSDYIWYYSQKTVTSWVSWCEQTVTWHPKLG